MTDGKKYIGVSGKYTKNGTPNGFISITPFIVVKNPLEAIEFIRLFLMQELRTLLNFPTEMAIK